MWSIWSRRNSFLRLCGDTLRIFLNSTYGQKLAVETESAHDLCIDWLILQPLSVRAIKKVSETAGLEACKIKVFPPAF
jgi:hypothetical protein